jgi:hypothetical protein
VDNRRRDSGKGVVITELDLLRNMSALSSSTQTRTRALSNSEEGLTETDTVSFSLTMGTTPICSSSENVFCAFKYLVRYTDH